jgi:hypothetical protein
MNDTTPPLPDRLSIDPRSKFHVAAVFEHDVGIKFNGKERWMWMNTASAKAGSRSRPAKALDRHGNPMLIKLKGTVEAFYR